MIYIKINLFLKKLHIILKLVIPDSSSNEYISEQARNFKCSQIWVNSDHLPTVTTILGSQFQFL